MTSSFLGAGFSPAGVSYAGFGSPASDNSYQVIKQTAKRIDPVSKDYVLDGSGNFEQVSEIENLVYLRLSTVKSSSVMAELGNTIPSIQTVSSSSTAEIVSQVSLALEDLTTANKISLDNVSVERFEQSGSLTIQVVYTDKASNRVLTAFI